MQKGDVHVIIKISDQVGCLMTGVTLMGDTQPLSREPEFFLNSCAREVGCPNGFKRRWDVAVVSIYVYTCIYIYHIHIYIYISYTYIYIIYIYIYISYTYIYIYTSPALKFR